MLLSAFFIATCVKLLFLPSYKSTDFEVHRNWLAITSSLPISQWYTEATSIWTLDYPPLFAWFEFLLAKVAVYFDKKMLEVDNLNYSSQETILFQRLSVIVTDFIYCLGAWKCAKNIANIKRKANLGGLTTECVLIVLLVCNAGLFIVDHIHFQYNGFLFGILLLSLSAILEGRCILGGFLFAVLLNAKHINVYLAPAFFIYLLRSYCFPRSQNSSDDKFSLRLFSPLRLIGLGLTVVLVFLASFGPFVHQIEQVFSRLFPFKRGLCHAYWAPNFWTIYNVADKALTIGGKKFGLLNVNTEVASMTGGLVQDIHHTVLPNIPPIVTFVLTGMSMVPALGKLWRSPYSEQQFLRCLILCGWSSFLFGWHVHEKAILLVIVPMTLLSVLSREEARYFLLVAITGHFSLFPLLFTSREVVTKVLIHFVYCCLSLGLLKRFHRASVLSVCDKLYLVSSIPVFLYGDLFHAFIPVLARYSFLPLLTYSVYASIGIIVSYIRFYRFYLSQ